MVKAPTANLEAYETYLRGLYFYNQFGEEAMSKAIPIFKKAIEMEPDFGLPNARLAICYMLSAVGGKISWDKAREMVMPHVNRLRELGAETPEVYFAMAVFEIFYQWNWPAALEVIKRGLEVFPNYPNLYHVLSDMHYIAGNRDQLVDSFKPGYELDPMSVEMNMFMGGAYFWEGRYEQALPLFYKVLEMVPRHRTAMEYKGWCYVFQENYPEALPIFEQLEPKAGFRLHQTTCLGWVYYKMQETDKATDCLQQLLELEKQSLKFCIDLATFYTVRGDSDKAFYFLEKAIRNKVGDSMMFRSDPFLAPLRNDPRFKEMEALVGEVPEISF